MRLPAALRRICLFLAAPAALGGCALFDGDGAPPRLETAGRFAEALRYEARLVGAEGDGELRDLLEASSRLLELEDQPPQGLLGLDRRIEADRERLVAAMRSLGYHAGTIEFEIGESAIGVEEPVPVLIRVAPGPRYVFAPPRVVRVGNVAAELPPTLLAPETLEIEPGEPALAEDVGEATRSLLQRVNLAGFPFPEIVERRVVVDHASRLVTVSFAVDSGPRARFGEVDVRGLEDVETRYVLRRIPWERGDPYDPLRLDALREALSERPVFSSVRIDPADALTPEGELPIDVVLEERPPRAVRIGVEFATSTGLGTQASWTHRNFRGGAERLRVEASVGGVGVNGATNYDEFDYRLGASYEEPDFLVPRQTLALDGALLREELEAYERTAATASARVLRKVWDDWTFGVGVTLERAIFDETPIDFPEEDVLLVGLPLDTALDAANDLLDPTQGFRWTANVTPYYDFYGTGFTSIRTSGSLYVPFGEDARVVLAGRVGIGTILGGSDARIPPDKRLYGGGGGSVRGYGFQMLGPLDADGDPIGGRGLAELGLETRIRVAENWGVVPFVDAGAVTREAFSGFDGLRVGAGLGVRYYSPIGPVRLDVAVPVDPRPEDDRFQLYVSVGQAF